MYLFNLCTYLLFFLCLVGLSLKKLTSIKMIKKILRPTTVISCGTMQEDWEVPNFQGKYLMPLLSAFFPT